MHLSYLNSREAHKAICSGGLSTRQYGFRPGRSTIEALKEVVDTVEAAQTGNHFRNTDEVQRRL